MLQICIIIMNNNEGKDGYIEVFFLETLNTFTFG